MLKVSDFHGVKKFDCEINGMKNELNSKSEGESRAN